MNGTNMARGTKNFSAEETDPSLVSKPTRRTRKAKRGNILMLS